MIVGYKYFCSKKLTSVQVMTPRYGGAANGLKCLTQPHYGVALTKVLEISYIS